MVKIENLQSTVVGIVKLAPVLAAFPFTAPDALDNHVFSDDGTMREAIEESLKMKGVGWAVVVSLPVGVNTKDQMSPIHGKGTGTWAGDALVNVCVRTNPKLNAGANAINPFVTVKQIIQQVKNWSPEENEKGFLLPPELPWSPDFTDEGCITYDIKVMKLVTLL